MRPKTLGEAVEESGYCLIMLKLADLAQAVGRIPVGEWDYIFRTDPRWRIALNGGPSAEWTPPDGMKTPQYHASVMFNGWPAALVHPAGGTVAGVDEETLLAALDKEITRVAASNP